MAQHVDDLPQKPMVEAIFEVNWASPISPRTFFSPTVSQQLFFAELVTRLRQDYPFARPLEAANQPVRFPGVVDTQFRKSPDGWPLIQTGSGILTVNDNQNYVWSSFRNQIQFALQALLEASKSDPLPNARLTLRYINAIPITSEFTPDSYLKKFGIGWSLPGNLFSEFGVEKEPAEFRLSSAYPVSDLGSHAFLKFYKGSVKEIPSLIWEIGVGFDEARPLDLATSMMDWPDKAHSLASGWFFNLIEGELFAQFNKKL